MQTSVQALLIVYIELVPPPGEHILVRWVLQIWGHELWTVLTFISWYRIPYSDLNWLSSRLGVQRRANTPALENKIVQDLTTNLPWNRGASENNTGNGKMDNLLEQGTFAHFLNLEQYNAQLRRQSDMD